jgi:hypothetical protein
LNSNESDSSSSDITMHSANTDDSHFVKITEHLINFFSNQVILKIDSTGSEKFEQIPKIFRRTNTKLSFTVPIMLRIFQDSLDPKRVNCIHYKKKSGKFSPLQGGN